MMVMAWFFFVCCFVSFLGFMLGLLALAVLALGNFGPRQWCPQTLPSPMLTPFVWHRLRSQLGRVLLQIHWRQWYSKHEWPPPNLTLFLLLWLWVFVVWLWLWLWVF